MTDDLIIYTLACPLCGVTLIPFTGPPGITARQAKSTWKKHAATDEHQQKEKDANGDVPVS